MKEQIKAPEKIQLSNKEIDSQPIRCRILITGNQDAHRIEYGCKIEEKVKAMQSEMKENVQGANSDGKETRSQINGLDQKAERNIQPEQNEETRIKKEMRRGLGTSRTTLNIPTSESEGCQKEKRKSKKLNT